jgi:hypothetical protein
MPTNVLNVRLGPRFLFVTLLPNLSFAALIAFLLLAGAPGRRPTLHEFDTAIGEISFVWILITFGVVATAVAVHPLTYLLVQLLEGYWERLPNGRMLRMAASETTRRRRQALYDLKLKDRAALSAAERQELQTAESQLLWLPGAAHPVLPTTLGNVLFAGEVRAGNRYGYDTASVWLQMQPMLGDDVRRQVADTRNQLDAAARFCALSLLAVPVALTLLIRYDVWLLVPIGCYLFAWMSYRSAVAAAKDFSYALAVAFDLHHLDLWDALGLERPADLDDEHGTWAPLLSTFLRGGPTPPHVRRRFVYHRATWPPASEATTPGSPPSSR